MASSLDNICIKRALLIGNNHYNKGKRLEYCINNVNDLKDKLEKIEFNVTVGIDLICDSIDTIIEQFVKQINIGDLVLFFYSGYGIHFNNQNSIIPIDDNQIINVKTFEYLTINVQNIIDMINNRRPSASIYLFDCFRSYIIQDDKTMNHFIDYGGFTNIEPLPNCLIIYSSSKDQLIVDKSINGRNTIFLYYLIQNIDQPNLSIDQLIDIIKDQILNETNKSECPTQIGSIRKNICFNFQMQGEMSQRRSSLIQKLISESINSSLVDLRNKQLIDRDIKLIVEKLVINKQCTRLWLDGNKITSNGAAILASALNNNTNLERLYLYQNCIQDIGVKYISKALSINNKTLKILGLQQNNITDLGIEHLSKMIQINKTLTGLWLNQNSISDKGVQTISNALKHSHSSIEYIDLSNNRLITDISTDYIIDIIKFNKSINELSLYHCNLSKNGKDKLKKASKLKNNFTIYLNSWNE